MGCTRSVLLFQNRLMLQVRLITSIPWHRNRNTFSEEKGQLSHILTPVMYKTFGYYWYKMSPQMPRQQNHNHIHQKTQFWYYCKYLCYRLCYRLCLCKMNLWLFCWKKMIKKKKRKEKKMCADDSKWDFTIQEFHRLLSNRRNQMLTVESTSCRWLDIKNKY